MLGISHHQGNFITISIDILRTSSIHEFTFELGKAVFEQAAHRGAKMLKMVVNTLKSINGCFGYDPVSNTPTFNLSLGDISNPLYTLDEIFSCLEQAEKKCIIAIDEFQQICYYPEKNMEAILRTHIQNAAMPTSYSPEANDISLPRCFLRKHTPSTTVLTS